MPPIVIIIFAVASAITAVVVVSVYVHSSLPIVLTSVERESTAFRSLSLPYSSSCQTFISYINWTSSVPWTRKRRRDCTYIYIYSPSTNIVLRSISFLFLELQHNGWIMLMKVHAYIHGKSIELEQICWPRQLYCKYDWAGTCGIGKKEVFDMKICPSLVVLFSRGW